MSHVCALRRRALQFLASKAVEKDSPQNSAVTACLQAETVGITSERTPERVLKTSKLGALTPVGQSAGSTEICTRWLISKYAGYTSKGRRLTGLLAQLKVNLMPLWKAASGALAVLFERCGEDIWPIFKAELDELFGERWLNGDSPAWTSHVANYDRSYQEDEKTWRNPGLNETLSALDGLGRGLTGLVQVHYSFMSCQIY